MAGSPDSEGTPSQIPYNPPHIEQLLTISAFLYLLPLSSALFDHILNAGLLGPLFLGIVFGPEAANILPNAIQTSFISIGYIGLLLLIFEGGLTTNISLFIRNLGLSTLVGLTGVGLPIAFSIILLHFSFDKSILQSFGAGAALCSTSLGTTLALMSPQMRRTKVGSVLMSAALLDDIIGLVMAAIIVELGSNSSSTIPPAAVVRPIFVSIAFGLFTPAIAVSTKVILKRFVSEQPWSRYLVAPRVQLFLIILSLFGFVTAAKFAGTSELFGAYLAGTFLCYVFDDLPVFMGDDIEESSQTITHTYTVTQPTGPSHPPSSPCEPSTKGDKSHTLHPTDAAFTSFITPLLNTFLSPLFFASVGAALPIRSLFSSSSTGGLAVGARVVWRGIVYSVFMIITKVAAGLWILVWPSRNTDTMTITSDQSLPSTSIINLHDESAARNSIQNQISASPCQAFALEEPKRPQSSLFLGLALVARGEIALIVAQLAKPLIAGPQGDDDEAFAIVLWAVLLSTIGGAVGVGVLLKSRWWKSGWRADNDVSHLHTQ